METKKLKPYRWRNRLVNILFAVGCLLLISYVVTEDWKDPNWTMLASLGLNAFFVTYLKFNYRNLTLQLYEDHIIFKPLGKDIEERINVTPESEFSKDWKGIYIKNGNTLDKVPLEFMSNKEGNRLYSQIRRFYNRE